MRLALVMVAAVVLAGCSRGASTPVVATAIAEVSATASAVAETRPPTRLEGCAPRPSVLTGERPLLTPGPRGIAIVRRDNDRGVGADLWLAPLDDMKLIAPLAACSQFAGIVRSADATALFVLDQPLDPEWWDNWRRCGGRHSLRRIGLPTFQISVVAEFADVCEARVSPDGRHVAWTDSKQLLRVRDLVSNDDRAVSLPTSRACLSHGVPPGGPPELCLGVMQLRWSWSGTYLSISRLVWEAQEALIVRVTEAELVAMPVTFGGPGPMDNSSASSWAPNRNVVCFVGDHGRGLVFDADLFQRVPIRNDVVSAGFEQIDGCAWGPSDLAVGRWGGQLEVLNLTTGSLRSERALPGAAVGWTDDGSVIVGLDARSMALWVVRTDGTVEPGPSGSFIAMLPR